jgi:ankyrin repeat protein
VKDKNGWTTLHGAALNGHEATVRSLLERGTEINANYEEGGRRSMKQPGMNMTR